MDCSRLILIALFVCFGYSAFSQVNGKHVPMPKDGVLDTLMFNDTTNVLTAITTIGDTFQVIIPDSTGAINVALAGVNIQVTENAPNDFTVIDTSATYFYVDSLFSTLSAGTDGTVSSVNFDNPTRLLTVITTAPDTFTAAIPDSVNPFQVLSWVEATRTLSLTNGGSVVIGDEVDDADADPANEIQDLGHIVSGTNRTVTITGGGSTTFSVADNDNSDTNETITAAELDGNVLEITEAGTQWNVDLTNLSGAGVNTIYSANDNLAGDRTVNTNGNNLTFSGSVNLQHNTSSLHPIMPYPGFGFEVGSSVMGLGSNGGNHSGIISTTGGAGTSQITVDPTQIYLQGNASQYIQLGKTGVTSFAHTVASDLRLNSAQIPLALPGAGNYLWQIDGSSGAGSWINTPVVPNPGIGIQLQGGNFNLGGSITGGITWTGSGGSSDFITASGLSSFAMSANGGNNITVSSAGVILNGLTIPNTHNKAVQGIYYYNGNSFLPLDAPASGTHTLKSVGGVIQWVQD